MLEYLEPLDYPRQALANLARGTGRALSGEATTDDYLGMLPGVLGVAGLAAGGGPLLAAVLAGLGQGAGRATGSQAFAAPSASDLAESLGGDRDSFVQTLGAQIATDPLTFAGAALPFSGAGRLARAAQVTPADELARLQSGLGNLAEQIRAEAPAMRAAEESRAALLNLPVEVDAQLPALHRIHRDMLREGVPITERWPVAREIAETEWLGPREALLNRYGEEGIWFRELYHGINQMVGDFHPAQLAAFQGIQQDAFAMDRLRGFGEAVNGWRRFSYLPGGSMKHLQPTLLGPDEMLNLTENGRLASILGDLMNTPLIREMNLDTFRYGDTIDSLLSPLNASIARLPAPEQVQQALMVADARGIPLIRSHLADVYRDKAGHSIFNRYLTSHSTGPNLSGDFQSALQRLVGPERIPDWQQLIQQAPAQSAETRRAYYSMENPLVRELLDDLVRRAGLGQ